MHYPLNDWLLLSVMLFRIRLLMYFFFCFCSSESHWLRSYAEIVSTAALSSSSLSWVQSSSTSNLTPSWRKPTSWRWQFVSWDVCSQSARPPAQQRPIRDTPSVSKRRSTSCPRRMWRQSQRKDFWATSRACSHPLIWIGGRGTWLSTTSRKRPDQSTAPPGGPGREIQTETLVSDIPYDHVGQKWAVFEWYHPNCLVQKRT